MGEKGFEFIQDHSEMEKSLVFEKDLNLEATELRLGLPGTKESEKQTPSTIKSNKRVLPDMSEECGSKDNSNVSHVKKCDQEVAPPAK